MNRKLILAIDPGTTKSAFVLFDRNNYKIEKHGILENNELLNMLRTIRKDVDFVIEMVASYGMAVGESVFETVFWIGRFWEAKLASTKTRIKRKQVTMEICKSARAKDSNIRKSLIDMFGGQEKAIGNIKCKKCKGKGWFGAGRKTCPECKGKCWEYPPGPLYGIANDEWQALALAITYTRILDNE